MFGRNEKTIRVHLKNIGVILGPEYEERAKLVKKNNYSNASKNRAKESGSKPKSISDEAIKLITETIVYEGLTLREAEERFNIPKSTIHDNITSKRVGEELFNLYGSTAEFNKATTNQDVESPIVIEHRKK